MTYTSALHYETSTTATRRGDLLPQLLIVGCVTFNFLLSVINANVTAVNTSEVQIVQLALTGAAVVLTLLRGGPNVPLRFGALIVAYCFGYAIAGFVAGVFDYKNLYDVLLLCSFIGLGSTMGHMSPRFVDRLLLLAIVAAAFEYFLPDLYAQVVNPQSYLSNTRDWVATALSDTFGDGAGLSLNGLRGDGVSWLGLTADGHRVGGIFLEPLSQGYFAALVAIFYCFRFRDFFWPRTLAVSICLLLALVSDTRLAVLLIGFAYLFTPVARRLPIGFAYAVPVVGAVVGFMLYGVYSLTGDSSEVAYRLSLTFQLLQDSPLYNVLFGGLDMTNAADSGIITIMARSGLIGLAAFFAIGPGLALRGRAPLFAILIAVYVLVTAIFGAAFLSIKTAALLGLLIGAIDVGAIGPKAR